MNTAEWYKKHPDKFIEEIFGVKLHWYQKLFLKCTLCFHQR